MPKTNLQEILEILDEISGYKNHSRFDFVTLQKEEEIENLLKNIDKRGLEVLLGNQSHNSKDYFLPVVKEVIRRNNLDLLKIWTESSITEKNKMFGSHMHEDAINFAYSNEKYDMACEILEQCKEQEVKLPLWRLDFGVVTESVDEVIDSLKDRHSKKSLAEKKSKKDIAPKEKVADLRSESTSNQRAVGSAMFLDFFPSGLREKPEPKPEPKKPEKKSDFSQNPRNQKKQPYIIRSKEQPENSVGIAAKIPAVEEKKESVAKIIKMKEPKPASQKLQPKPSSNRFALLADEGRF